MALEQHFGDPCTAAEVAVEVGDPVDGGRVRLEPHPETQRRTGTVLRVVDLESDQKWILGEPGDGPVTSWDFDSRGRLVVTRGGAVSRWNPHTEATVS